MGHCKTRARSAHWKMTERLLKSRTDAMLASVTHKYLSILNTLASDNVSDLPRHPDGRKKASSEIFSFLELFSFFFYLKHSILVMTFIQLLTINSSSPPKADA